MAFIDDFTRVAAEWRAGSQDEWLFARLQRDVVTSLTPAEAFGSIEAVVEALLGESDSYLFYETLVTIGDLARQSDTTEVSQALLDAIPELRERCSALCSATQAVLKEVLRHYRLSVRIE